jgi:hypothetical protein
VGNYATYLGDKGCGTCRFHRLRSAPSLLDLRSLWLRSIDPIMRGTEQPSNADKPLPPVSSELVEACKRKNPNFGEGNKGAAKGK